MSKELQTTNQNQLQSITEDELVGHLHNMGLLKDLTTGEKNTYLQICKAYNLNPFKREVHVSKYNGQMSIIVGYESYIKRAERSGVLDGWDVKVEGEVMDPLAKSTLKAIITIYRKDRTRPFVWEAKFTEYMQIKDGRLNKFWQKSETMIKKVAMAQGFRLCFNDELGGMPYSKEELPDVEDIQHIEIKKTETNLEKKLNIAATIDSLNSAETIELLATTWNQLGDLKAIPEVLAAKEKRKAELKPITQEVPLVLTWSLSPEKQKELDGLIKNSTMSNADKSTATTRIASAKNHIEIEQIELRLKSLQNAV
jgi:phage recombination protein Bet